MTYSQVVVAPAGTLVFVAGQEPEDPDGYLVGPGDLATQARQGFANLGRTGAVPRAPPAARPNQGARIRYLVVRRRPEFLPVIEQARGALFGGYKPADT